MEQKVEQSDGIVRKKEPNLGIASIIVSVVAMISSFLFFPAIVFGFIGIILGIIQLMIGKRKGFALSGIALGFMAFLLSFFILLDVKNVETVKEDVKSDLNSAINELENSLDETDVNYNSLIYGTWVLENASYELNQDGTWGWYKDYRDLSDNFYSGTDMTVVNGQTAIDLVGIDEEGRERLNIDKHRFFYIQLPVNKFVSKGEDRSDEIPDQDANYTIVLYFPEWMENNKAVLINVDTMEQFGVTRLIEEEE